MGSTGQLTWSLLVAAAFSTWLATGSAHANPTDDPASATVERSLDGAPDPLAEGQLAAPESIVEIGARMQPGSNIVKAADPTMPPECASDPERLGLSRIVEIDTTGGPEFGGHVRHQNDFLQDREVVLTFDDGPMRAYTRRILDALAAECTRATFFMVGRMAAADPAMVKEVAAEGHTVAAHTWSHKNLRAVGQARAEQDFEMGVSAVARAAGGAAAPFFRFPYLSESRAILAHAGSRDIASFWVDVDSKDYLTRSASEVQRRIMAQLSAKGRGIILMHDIQPSSVGAIRPLLKELRLRGYKVVHIVAKANVDTLSEYDPAVERAFAGKSKSRGENDLADRSVVWQADFPEDEKPSRPAQRRTVKRAPAPAYDDSLPWLAPAKTKPARKSPSSSDGAQWLFPF